MVFCQAMAERSGLMVTMLETGKISDDNIGTEVYSYGFTYVGAWKDGYRHGKGKLTNEKGKIYEGNWVEDHFNGVYYEKL